MKTKTLIKKIEQIKVNHAKENVKRKRKGYSEIPGDGLSLTYRVRANRFTNSSKSCEVWLNDDGSWSGHSYTWYDLVKTIKGKVVLNTYRYSVQTSKHIAKVERLFEKLGVKYIEIEAPRGLQNLEVAKFHAALEHGRAVVLNKYARKGNGHYSRDGLIKNLAKIGVKLSKKDLAYGVKQAEEARKNKLERQKRMKLERAEYLAKREAEKLEREKASTPELSIIQGGQA